MSYRFKQCKYINKFKVDLILKRNEFKQYQWNISVNFYKKLT